MREREFDVVLIGAGPAGEVAAGRLADGGLSVVDTDAATIGHVAFESHVELHELRPATSDLEQVFLSLTGGAES